MIFTFFIIFAKFSRITGYLSVDQLTADSQWSTVCRELKPVHVFYEDYDEEISCRLRDPQPQE